MAAVVKNGVPSTSTLAPPPNCQATKIAFEDITQGQELYIKSDDTFAVATGAAANAAALAFGIAACDAKAGQPVTARHSVQISYPTAAGLTPGARLYLGTAGGYDTATTTGGTVAIAIVMDAKNIYRLPPTR